MTCPWFSSLLEELESRLPGLAWIFVSEKREGEGADTRKQREGWPLSPYPECAHPSAPRIVEEVRSIRFNQEQEEELLQRHLSKTQSLGSRSSIDLREMASQQDLISALAHREKVPFSSPTRSVLIPPPYPAQPSLLSEELVQVFQDPPLQTPSPSSQGQWANLIRFHLFFFKRSGNPSL